MAEALGLVASIIAVVQLAESITRTCTFLIESIEGCPRDLRLILLEASAIKALFQNLEFMKKHDPEAAVFLNGIEGSVTGCLESITELENLIPHTIPLAAARKRKRPKTDLTLASLAWPLKRAKAKSLLHVISQHKATISAMISAEALQDVKDIKHDLRSVSAKITDAERYNIYKWLQRTDPSPNHNTACSLYENGTGDWVLRIAEWHDWTSIRCRCLWIHGIPGAGKTVLASHLIEQTSHLDTCGQGEEMPVASVYYYCYHARNQDEAAPFLRWIITKLCQKVESVPSRVFQIFKLGNEPRLEELVASFEEILESFRAVFITIDAIDESQHRENLLNLLRDIINDPRFGNVQLLITSREYIDIKEAISTISQPVSMSNPCVEADIKTYVAAKIQSTTRFRSWPRDLCEEVQNALSEGAKGMFRWAVCQLDILRRLHDIARIRLALKDLPIGLDETYTRIFSYVPEEDWPLLQHVLWMICCHSIIYVSFSSLYTNTLLVTFPIFGPGDTALRKSLHSSDLLKEICGCLVTFESCGENHKEVAVLAHYTVREFLESDRSNRGPTTYFHLDVDQVKKKFLTIALQHIMNVESYDMIGTPHVFEPIKDWAELSQINVDNYYLVSATCAIGLWESIITNDKMLMTAVIQFLDPSAPTSRRSYEALRHFFKNMYVREVSSDMNSRNHFWEIDWIRSPNNTQLTTLTHMLFGEYIEIAKKFASTFEYAHIACLELSIRWSCYDCIGDSYVDARFDGTIVDFLAQSARFELRTPKPLELICQLLENSLDPTSVLVSYIGSHQHKDCLSKCMIDWLLECGADPHGSGHRVTPLQIAVSNGDSHGVKSLLQAGANPNALGNRNGLKWGPETTFGILFNDLYGKSPLSIADNIEASNNEIVDLLIQSKGTYNCPN